MSGDLPLLLTVAYLGAVAAFFAWERGKAKGYKKGNAEGQAFVHEYMNANQKEFTRKIPCFRCGSVTELTDKIPVNLTLCSTFTYEFVPGKAAPFIPVQVIIQGR